MTEDLQATIARLTEERDAARKDWLGALDRAERAELRVAALTAEVEQLKSAEVGWARKARAAEESLEDHQKSCWKNHTVIGNGRLQAQGRRADKAEAALQAAQEQIQAIYSLCYHTYCLPGSHDADNTVLKIRLMLEKAALSPVESAPEPRVFSPELRALAEKAVAANRKPNDIEKWARELAADAVAAGEVESAPDLLSDSLEDAPRRTSGRGHHESLSSRVVPSGGEIGTSASPLATESKPHDPLCGTDKAHPACWCAAERIVAAAIRQDGMVFTGPHHHQIIRYMCQLLGLKTVRGEQGFVTNRNRYVGREEAARIAFLAKQTDREWSGLCSEYVWSVPDYVFIGGVEAGLEYLKSLQATESKSFDCEKCGERLAAHCIYERWGDPCRNHRETCHAASYSCGAPSPALPADHHGHAPRCSHCNRIAFDRPIGEVCNFPQPSGRRCEGVFSAPSPDTRAAQEPKKWMSGDTLCGGTDIDWCAVHGRPWGTCKSAKRAEPQKTEER